MDNDFPNYIQKSPVSCGLFCLKIISKHYQKIVDISHYSKRLEKKGLSIFDLCEIAEEIGFKTNAYELTYNDLKSIKHPLILHWNKNHYVVLYEVSNDICSISDPTKGLIQYDKKDFFNFWCDNQDKGKVVSLIPSEKFNEKSKKTNYLSAIEFLIRHLTPYKKNLLQLLTIIIVISLIYSSLPFITRSIIDVGIGGNDFNFIVIILIANISLLIFRSLGEWIKASISLHIASRMKISIVTDYLIKVFSLPVSYIDNMLLGDIIQRSRDQEKIQQFVSNSAISIFMSLLIISIYGVILAIFNKALFFIFFISTILYIIWVMFFYGIRKKMDIKYYKLMGENQSSWIEMLRNFEDIKLNNYSINRRWKWESIQASLYHVGIKLLNVDRVQQLGADFINGLKDIGLTFYGAYLVMQGEISLGTLISIQFIIGQVTKPVTELITFIKTAQSAFISYLRVNEINIVEEEQEKSQNLIKEFSKKNNNIHLKNVSFKYKGERKSILNNVSFSIPESKTTVIVGASGSGKTTILRLLTKIHNNYLGEISIGKNNLKNFENDFLRKKTGVVLQDSNLYKGTILNNIVLNEEKDYNIDLIEKVLTWVNLENELHELPNGLNTEISEGGKGLSQGQKQRLLLARALYRRPKLLILDEVTNAIDSISEKKILKLFSEGLINQTIVLVSHKLSTIKCADYIIVMDKGSVIEKGTYDQLTTKKTHFQTLFKEQIN